MGNIANSEKKPMRKEDLIIYSTPEELANVFADHLMSWINEFSGDAYHLAISGGKTPNLLFGILASQYANSPLWQKVHFWWVDERMVPPTDPESNFGVAQKLLFSRISIPEENIHRIKGENNPQEEALSYSDHIKNCLQEKDGWPVFNLILLGMGDDGHTASIFPDQLALMESELICEVAIHPSSGQKRVTLTGKVINSATKICFLITGKEKSATLYEIISKSGKSRFLPASYIEKSICYIDKAASYILDGHF